MTFIDIPYSHQASLLHCCNPRDLHGILKLIRITNFISRARKKVGERYTAGVPNQSIAIYRSIFICLTVDRGCFYACTYILIKIFQNINWSIEREKIWKVLSEEKYPNIKKCAFYLLSCFGSTYLCESVFSHMKIIKSRYRSVMTDQHLLACLRLATTSYCLNYEEIVTSSQCQVSH